MSFDYELGRASCLFHVEFYLVVTIRMQVSSDEEQICDTFTGYAL